MTAPRQPHPADVSNLVFTISHFVPDVQSPGPLVWCRISFCCRPQNREGKGSHVLQSVNFLVSIFSSFHAFLVVLRRLPRAFAKRELD